MSYAHIADALATRRRFLIDAATGTELERRGVEMDPAAWCGPSTLQHRSVLVDIHRDYVDIGAELITANTFASGPSMLRAAGYDDQHIAIVNAAVDAVREAIASSPHLVAIAGSMSHMIPVLPGTDVVDPSLGLVPPRFHEDCVRHATALADAGVDVLLLEMMYQPDRAAIVLDAARSTGLPVWFGISARRGQSGDVISFDPHSATPLVELLGLASGSVDAVSVMHTRADIIEDVLKVVRGVTNEPLVIYPDSGHFEMPSWNFTEVMSPADFGGYCERWLRIGVSAVGGCCGLGPDHLRAARSAIDRANDRPC